MTTKAFKDQALDAFKESLNNLGVSASYQNGAGSTKIIKVLFRNRETEIDDEPTRIVGQRPEIRVLSSDIDDRNTDAATFTIDSVVYKADQYIDAYRGVMKIILRA